MSQSRPSSDPPTVNATLAISGRSSRPFDGHPYAMTARHGHDDEYRAPGRTGLVASDQQSRLLGAYRRLTECLRGSPTLSRLYLDAVEEACRLMESDRALLCRRDAVSPDYLRIVAGSGPLARLEGAVLPRTGSFEGFVLDRGGVTRADTLDNEADHFRTAEHRRYVGPVIATRLEGQGEILGVVLVARAPGSRPFLPEQDAAIAEIAALVSSGIAVAESLERARGGRHAIDAWRAERSARLWLTSYRDIFASRGEVAFRLSPGGEVEWGPTAAMVLGDAASVPDTLDGLLERVGPDERLVLQASLRRLATDSGSAGLSVTCTLRVGPERFRPVRIRVWEDPPSPSLLGVISEVAAPLEDASAPPASQADPEYSAYTASRTRSGSGASNGADGEAVAETSAADLPRTAESNGDGGPAGVESSPAESRPVRSGPAHTTGEAPTEDFPPPQTVPESSSRLAPGVSPAAQEATRPEAETATGADSPSHSGSTPPAILAAGDATTPGTSTDAGPGDPVEAAPDGPEHPNMLAHGVEDSRAASAAEIETDAAGVASAPAADVASAGVPSGSGPDRLDDEPAVHGAIEEAAGAGDEPTPVTDRSLADVEIPGPEPAPVELSGLASIGSDPPGTPAVHDVLEIADLASAEASDAPPVDVQATARNEDRDSTRTTPPIDAGVEELPTAAPSTPNGTSADPAAVPDEPVEVVSNGDAANGPAESGVKPKLAHVPTVMDEVADAPTEDPLILISTEDASAAAVPVADAPEPARTDAERPGADLEPAGTLGVAEPLPGSEAAPLDVGSTPAVEVQDPPPLEAGEAAMEEEAETDTYVLTDFHNHLVPGVDDGAVDEAHASSALERVHAAGVRHLIVTPHLRMSVLKTGDPVVLHRAFDRLVAIGRERFPDLKISRGTEVMLDDPEVDLSTPSARLAGGRFVLVEFPGFWIPPYSALILSRVMEAGYVPVIAHPERYENGSARQAMAWREAGARLQVNCGSLLGQYRPSARDRAWQLLEAGSVDYLASDYHARGVYPIEGCMRLLEENDGAEQADLLLKVNPSRLALNKDPVDVGGIERPTSLLRRLARGMLFR